MRSHLAIDLSAMNMTTELIDLLLLNALNDLQLSDRCLRATRYPRSRNGQEMPDETLTLRVAVVNEVQVMRMDENDGDY